MAEAGTATNLAGRRILLGVSGGIAAYKACELASRLAREKALVTTVLTRAARKFVTPYTFEALTGQPCLTRMFARLHPGGSAFPHITPALEAELVVLAPATANLIARLACGLADELLPTLCLIARGPILVCPAMNTRMWEHPATQRNVRTLIGFGYRIIGPGSGDLACGMVGPGRMAEPEDIFAAIVHTLTPAPAGTPAVATPPVHAGPGAKVRLRRHGRPRPKDGPAPPASPPA